ncbi:hypothetical protein STEG23_032873, partial [Scotinomys teguina]
ERQGSKHSDWTEKVDDHTILGVDNHTIPGVDDHTIPGVDDHTIPGVDDHTIPGVVNLPLNNNCGAVCSLDAASIMESVMLRSVDLLSSGDLLQL